MEHSLLKRGNSKIAIIVAVIVIVALAGLVFWKGGSSKPANTADTAKAVDNSANAGAAKPVTLDVSDGSITSDISSVDGSLTSLSNDSANVDAALNDTPITIPQ